MIISDPTNWFDRLNLLDERVMARIEAVWPQCMATLHPFPHEDTISFNLRSLLVKDHLASYFLLSGIPV